MTAKTDPSSATSTPQSSSSQTISSQKPDTTKDVTKDIAQTSFLSQQSSLGFSDKFSEITFKAENPQKHHIDGHDFKISATRLIKQEPSESKVSKKIGDIWDSKWISPKAHYEEGNYGKMFASAALLPFAVATGIAPLGIAAGIEIGTRHGKAALANAFNKVSNNPEYEYVGLTDTETDKAQELIKDLWMACKKDIDTKDVLKLQLRIPVKDGKADYSGKIALYAVIKEKDKKTGLIKIKKVLIVEGSFSGDSQSSDDLFVKIGNILDLKSMLDKEKRPGISLEEHRKHLQKGHIPFLKENESGSSSSASKTSDASPASQIKGPKALARTSNNCWLHAGIAGLLIDGRIKPALNEYFEKYEKENKDPFPTDEAFTKIEKQTRSLRKCLKECTQSPSADKIPEIINKYSADIRTELGAESLSSQEDVMLLIYSSIQDFLDRLQLLSPITIEKTQTLKQLKKTSEKPSLSDAEIGVDQHIIVNEKSLELDLQSYNEDSVDASKLINSFFNNNNENILENYYIDRKHPEDKHDWKIKQESRSFNKAGNTVSFQIKRFRANGTKITSSLIAVPRELAYENNQFIPKSGSYKLSYAIIHHGGTESGHYYTVYYSDNSWYKYDTGTTIKIEATDLDEHLKDAVYLHYQTY